MLLYLGQLRRSSDTIIGSEANCSLGFFLTVGFLLKVSYSEIVQPIRKLGWEEHAQVHVGETLPSLVILAPSML